MFTHLIPPEMFAAQRQFISKMEANRDFVWWARSLITEEVQELADAHNNDEGMEQIFKELADVLYVVCGCFNTMPANAPELLTEELNDEIQQIMDGAWQVFNQITTLYKIPVNLVGEAFSIVHLSNMSKLGEDGKPIRRQDGKVLKGPNYTAPSMAPVVMKWDKYVEQLKQEEAHETSI